MCTWHPTLTDKSVQHIEPIYLEFEFEYTAKVPNTHETLETHWWFNAGPVS